MLELKHIHKDYFIDKKPFTAIKDLSLSFPASGFVAILGQSGCGKTTLLNIIGGLDKYTSGDLLIDGKTTKDFSSKEWDAYRNKRIGFVFQNYNLIPHLSVAENVEISMTLNGASSKTRKERSIEVLKLVGLEEEMKKKPNQLSGGQMQRVAIARALVNNPDIVLADEPTGALDSATSVQVIELIKNISVDRLVIMVTHNRELAEKYADRIIEMKDGEVISDSKPENGASVESDKLKNKKTSMSFLTALKSSGKNVWTKKGRTALTAIACSFGIIGVALVLATRNGFSSYVGTVETDVAGSVPITVSPTVYDYKSVITTNDEEYPNDNLIHVESSSTSTYVAHRNNYGTDYFQYLDRLMTDDGLKGLASSVVYNRLGLDFHLLTENGASGKYMKVSQYSSAGTVSSAVASITSLPSTVFHELYAYEKYDTIYGRFPENKNEIVLIVDECNRISLTTLKRLGIIDSSSSTFSDTISFSDIIYDGEGDTSYKPYKCYRTSDYYDVASGPKTKTVKAWDLSYNSLTVSPSGEVDWDSTFNHAAITKDITYYTEGKEPASSTADFYKQIYQDDAKYNPIDLKIVGVLRPSRESFIGLMPASIGYTTALKDELVADTQEGNPGYAVAHAQATNYAILRNSEEASYDGFERLKQNLNALIESGVSEETELSQEILLGIFNNVYRYFYAYSYYGTEPGNTTSATSFMSMNYYVGGDLSVKSGPATLDDWFDVMTAPDFFRADFLKYIAFYSSYAGVTSILIFPTALSTKDALRAYLDAYNKGKADADCITYTDVMATITSSIGTMINVISVVLVVFASISLVVSSVMTAIITYVSVIERTKEIGILRACGARKKDVGRIFESECIITGLFAGVLGIAVAGLATLPINYVLSRLYPGAHLGNIANLRIEHAVILLALSIGLAFLSGFIPARIAAAKDPVTCLRSE